MTDRIRESELVLAATREAHEEALLRQFRGELDAYPCETGAERMSRIEGWKHDRANTYSAYIQAVKDNLYAHLGKEYPNGVEPRILQRIKRQVLGKIAGSNDS